MSSQTFPICPLCFLPMTPGQAIHDNDLCPVHLACAQKMQRELEEIDLDAQERDFKYRERNHNPDGD